MHLPLLHRHKNSNQIANKENTWLQAWSKAIDLFDNPISRSLLNNGYPPITVTEDARDVVVTAEVPGMCSKDINLSYQDGILSISGEKKEEKVEGEVYRETTYGYFSREIPLGKSLKWEMAKAQCQNGLLSVKIPKKEGMVSKVKVAIE